MYSLDPSVMYTSSLFPHEQVLRVTEDLETAAKYESNTYSRTTLDPILVVNQWQGISGKFELCLVQMKFCLKYKVAIIVCIVKNSYYKRYLEAMLIGETRPEISLFGVRF